MTKAIKRHNDKLLAKARQIVAAGGVESRGHGEWIVTSTSGERYLVEEQFGGDLTCNCEWAQHRREFGGGGTGCSHTLAVVVATEAEQGRRAYAHDGEENARRQHRPLTNIGHGLWATSRA